MDTVLLAIAQISCIKRHLGFGFNSHPGDKPHGLISFAMRGHALSLGLQPTDLDATRQLFPTPKLQIGEFYMHA